MVLMGLVALLTRAIAGTHGMKTAQQLRMNILGIIFLLKRMFSVGCTILSMYVDLQWSDAKFTYLFLSRPMGR